MPIAISTSDTFQFVLLTDQSKQDKPTFIFRYLSAKEYRQTAKLFTEREEVKTIDDLDKLGNRTITVLKSYLKDWRNITDRDGKPMAYDPERLEDILSQLELREFEDRFLSEMVLNEHDLKKSKLQLVSAGDNMPATALNSVAAGSPN
ncbi:MAG: hypothetical protein ABIP54_03715 [Candidatus Andersenbacteria bacterium]